MRVGFDERLHYWWCWQFLWVWLSDSLAMVRVRWSTHDALRHPARWRRWEDAPALSQAGSVASLLPWSVCRRRVWRCVPPRQNCVLPPPAEKLIQNPLRKTKPPRYPPAVSAQTPSSCIWLSCFPRFRPGGSFDLDRLVEKWRRSHHPPSTTNIVDFPTWTPSQCAFPRPSEPTPRRTLINCHVFEARDRAEQSNSSSWSQFNDFCLLGTNLVTHHGVSQSLLVIPVCIQGSKSIALCVLG